MNAINHSSLDIQKQIQFQHSVIFALVEAAGGRIEIDKPIVKSQSPGPVMIKETHDGRLLIYSRPLNANDQKAPD